MSIAPSLIDRRRLFTLGAGLALASCAEPQASSQPVLSSGAPTPLDLSASRLMRITVCSRPFRPAGPRLEEERLGEKRVIHNYGHGGAGWSLTWGCAEEVLELAMRERPGDVAVIGAGALGLASALRLAEEGLPVTIYAEDFPSESRSARATGTWSPDSRISLDTDIAPDFGDRWERWARKSYSVHQHFVGLDHQPVEFTPRYRLRDDEGPASEPAERSFSHFYRRISDMLPLGQSIDPAAHGFTTAKAYQEMSMTFNVAQYFDDLMTAYLLRGGKIQRRRFDAAEEVMALPQTLIVNCTGMGAKALFDDNSLVPVRGQIAWLAPQPGVQYGVYYKNGTALARRDGIVIQDRGPNEDFGYGIGEETPNQAEFEATLATMASCFATPPSSAI
ncbi:MAG: FAD-dependent oxidoreductase [Pseudomonadota bacterium]